MRKELVKNSQALAFGRAQAAQAASPALSTRRRGGKEGSMATPGHDKPWHHDAAAVQNAGMDEVTGLFATPFMRVPGAMDTRLVAGLVEHFSHLARQENNTSAHLSHTQMLKPSDSPLLVEVAQRVTPKLVNFGSLLFGERLGWSIKEAWVNLLDTGGRQAMHNHANSFISGVVYLTPTHPSARTVFMKAPGGTEFSFKNDHAGAQTGPYNAD
eukprot:gene52327-69989_t